MITFSEKKVFNKVRADEFYETAILKNRQHFFGVRFDNISKDIALNAIRNFLSGNGKRRTRKVFFTNVHTISIAEHDPVFAETINNADLVLPDGSGLKIAGKIFSKPVKENINGTDFTPLILKTASELGSSVYLLGSTQEVINKCVPKLQTSYPGLRIAGYHSGFFSPDEEKNLIERIEKISPDILLVAMGSPKQEIFVSKIGDRLKRTVCFAVGGLFDFMSGNKKRAPLFLRKLGLEWLYRFTQDPKSKWERIVIEIPSFLVSVFTSRFFTNNIFSSADRRLSLML